MTVVWDEEALVDSYDHVEIDDCDLDREVENVEACFALVVGWVGPWPFSTCIVDTSTEGCPCAEENSSQEQNRYLMPEPPTAKFLHTGLARYGEPANDEQDGEEGYERVQSLAVELDVAVDAFGVRVNCVGGLDHGGDKGDQTEHDDDVYADESIVEDRMPAGVGMRGPDDALGKEEINNKE